MHAAAWLQRYDVAQLVYHAGRLVMALEIFRLAEVLGGNVLQSHQTRPAFDDSPPERVQQIQAALVLRHLRQHVITLVVAFDELGLMIERELEDNEIAKRLQCNQGLVQNAKGGRLLLRKQQPRRPR